MKPSVVPSKFSIYINAFFHHTLNESKKMGIKIRVKKRGVLGKHDPFKKWSRRESNPRPNK